MLKEQEMLTTWLLQYHLLPKNKIAKFEGGKILETSLVARNFARVVYIPEVYREITLNDLTDEQKGRL
jgi:hypothetical protein